ncbi:MAG: hypothetical protein HOC71_14320 [Candidatus Latescibacteria bacterium]|jgi:peptidyl-prolyl cis-trans isomerase D|nr:hypothetical protein [Candidatus Latescibacterota bacterium]
MLKTLRTNTKWIMLVVAVCFVAMIIFAWGMDITNLRTGGTRGIVGKINGEEVSYQYYDSVLKSQLQQFGDNTRMTQDQTRRIREEAWNNIVTQMILQQEIKKRKITYSDQELIDFMRNNPPSFVYQIPSFQENEQFSLRKYQAFLNAENLKDPMSADVIRYIEAEASGRLPAIKFQQNLTEAVYLSESDVREHWLMDNDRRTVEWVFLNVNDLFDVDINTAPDDIQTYFYEHQEDFRRGERRSLNAVFFELSASAEDSSEVLELAEMLVQKARSGEDFAALANEYSDDPGNIEYDGTRRGGDLGYFGRGRMIPEFENTAFSLNPGEVSDPVLTQFGYHVIHVDSVKYKDKSSQKEIDQVKARHILMNIEPSGKTREDAENKVTSFYETVTDGVDFMLQTQIDSLQVIHTLPFDEKANIVQGIRGSTSVLVNRAFRAKQGELLPVLTTDSGYYVMTMEQVLKEGIPSIEEIGHEIAPIVRREALVQYSEEYINRVYTRLQGGQSLNAAVEADSLKASNVQTTDVFRNYHIPGLGSMNPFIARVFLLENPGDTTGPVVTEYGSGIAVLVEKLPIDEEQYEKESEELKNRIESQLKNEIVSTYLDRLKEQAKIIDNRDIIYGL